MFSLAEIKKGKWTGKTLHFRRYNLHAHPPSAAAGTWTIGNAPSQDLFYTCEHFRCELVSSSCIQGMGSSFPGSAASPLLLQGICLFCRSFCRKSFLQPTNMRATMRGTAQLCSPRHFIAFYAAGLLTHETKVIYTTSLTLQAPDTHD